MAKKTSAIEDDAERVALAIDTAETWKKRTLVFDPRPGDTTEWGYAAGWWRDGQADPFGLPRDCPVTPLGVDDDVYWFLDAIGQVRAVPVKNFSRNMITSLFGGRVNYVMHHWPRLKGEGDKAYIDTFKPERVTDDLIAACSAKGNWNDVESVRGRGAWRTIDGALVFHCGDRLITGSRERPLGEIDGFVYPARPPLPGALTGPLTGRPGPAVTLLPLLRKWEWARPDLDPVLALGWLGCVFLSGALEWRPAIYAVGDKATGKSYFQRLLKYTLGGWLVQSNDATAAGIYQRVKHDATGVAIDELESEKDAAKQKAIIKLMRVSSSGGLMLRGGSDHKGTEFQARSCFVFSSINTPPLEPQDLSRMALLELKPLKEGAVTPTLNERELVLIGRQVMQKLIDNWPTWQSRNELYREMLARAGHKGRGQDTFGTLMTVADMIIDTDAEKLGVEMGPVESVAAWEPVFAAAAMTELQDDNANWRLALNQILTTPVEAWRGGIRPTVGAMLQAFWSDEGQGGEDHLTFDKMNRELAAAGLTMKRSRPRATDHRLFIPNQNPTLQRLFYNTKWYGEPGAGVWAGALRQAPEDWVETSCQGWISGVNGRGCEIPLEKIMQDFTSSDDGREAEPR